MREGDSAKVSSVFHNEVNMYTSYINQEGDKMIKKGVIIETEFPTDGFVSNIFTREKSDGSLRIILDLTKLNDNVTYRHFKMSVSHAKVGLYLLYFILFENFQLWILLILQKAILLSNKL